MLHVDIKSDQDPIVSHLPILKVFLPCFRININKTALSWLEVILLHVYDELVDLVDHYIVVVLDIGVYFYIVGYVYEVVYLSLLINYLFLIIGYFKAQKLKRFI